MEELFLPLYNKGLSDYKIAAELNIDRKKIGIFRKSLNLEPASKITAYKELFIDYVEKGYSDRMISEKLNISKSMTQNIRKKLGLKTNFIERNYSNREDRIKGYMIRNLKGSAKRRNLEFNLEYTDIILPRYCPILEFELDYSKNISYAINTHTIDRINNSKGYIKGNIIVISRLANAMKNEANFNQLKLFSKNILNIICFNENQGARGNITDIFFNNEELSLDS